MVYVLDHQYTDASLASQNLKRSDKVRVEALLAGR